jgi:hypothetical protein
MLSSSLNKTSFIKCDFYDSIIDFENSQITNLFLENASRATYASGARPLKLIYFCGSLFPFFPKARQSF